MSRAVRTAVRAAVVAVALSPSCGEPSTTTRSDRLTAYCEATVDTAGGRVVVDTETDYLPRVVACENGNAAPAALEAQAIAARSYLYYRLDRTGSIGDGQSDQVYTCGRAPGPAHVAAARATSGIVLQYPEADATQVAAFYVAGALQDGPPCRGGTSDPTNTERYVTYNEGQSGGDVIQTTLGLVDPANLANRGCMSQNGSDCLADAGYDVRAILRFYYGDDIAIVQAAGPCVESSGAPDAGGGAGVGDDATSGCSAGAAGAGAALGLATFLLFRGAPRRRRIRWRRR
jgi:hypothetical protein